MAWLTRFLPLVVLSSAASAFDRTDPQIHVLCDFTRLLTSIVNDCCISLKTPSRFHLFLIAYFKVFLSHIDGGSIVYVRGRGVLLSDLPVSPIACAQLFDVSRNPIIVNLGRAVNRTMSQWEARRVLSDKGICELLRRELEGKDEDCKHGSYLRPHYFLSDSLLLLAPLHCSIDFFKAF